MPARAAPCGGGASDASPDDGGVFHPGADFRVDMPSAEADDRHSVGCGHALGRGRGPPRLAAEHSQQRRLVQPELPIGGADPQDDLARLDPIPFVQAPHLCLLAEHLPQEGLRLAQAAKQGAPPGKHLHRHDRIELFGREDVATAAEVNIRVVARQRRSRGRVMGRALPSAVSNLCPEDFFYMPQGPFVLLGIKAGHAIGRDLDRIVAVAQPATVCRTQISVQSPITTTLSGASSPTSRPTRSRKRHCSAAF